ncbi:UNVERIFIED_CONTAM: hypothetical protein K2H54_030609 [Gekko kuhli]
MMSAATTAPPPPITAPDSVGADHADRGAGLATGGPGLCCPQRHRGPDWRWRWEALAHLPPLSREPWPVPPPQVQRPQAAAAGNMEEQKTRAVVESLSSDSRRSLTETACAGTPMLAVWSHLQENIMEVTGQRYHREHAMGGLSSGQK